VDLGKYCTGFEYTDNAHSAPLTSCRVTLEDRERKLAGRLAAQKSRGDLASIQCFDWFKPGDSLRLDCGNFTIDELHLTGPPNIVQLTGCLQPGQPQRQY
jgi:hypothetical protein